MGIAHGLCQARGWQDAGLPQVQIAVNMSVQQFRLSGIVNVVKRALQETGLAPEWLELELTESLILENADRIIQVMHDLKALGVSLSLDDFGTGYSSLAYLQRFPIDRIKIDKSFIRDVAIKTESAALVRAIVAMAHSLGLSTIAEGVENDSQLGYLRKQFCHEMQGFFYSAVRYPKTSCCSCCAMIASWIWKKTSTPRALPCWWWTMTPIRSARSTAACAVMAGKCWKPAAPRRHWTSWPRARWAW